MVIQKLRLGKGFPFSFFFFRDYLAWSKWSIANLTSSILATLLNFDQVTINVECFFCSSTWTTMGSNEWVEWRSTELKDELAALTKKESLPNKVEDTGGNARTSFNLKPTGAVTITMNVRNNKHSCNDRFCIYFR